MDKPNNCDKCGGSKLVLGTCTEERDGVRVVIVCESCGRIMRATTDRPMAEVRNWYADN
jgi:transcription elongation factor Elf1